MTIQKKKKANFNVGIAVFNATNAAKGAASAVLMSDKLNSLISLVTVGRQVHQRIATWILVKVIAVFRMVVFLVTMFFILGFFIIDAPKMLILLFLMDFVAIALATDNVRPSKGPATWKIAKLGLIGGVIGLFCVGESIGLLYIGIKVFYLTRDELSTFTFTLMFFFGLFSLMSVRERSWFFSSRPSLYVYKTIEKLSNCYNL